eukprot:3632134-Prymnesium_polylepis.1
MTREWQGQGTRAGSGYTTGRVSVGYTQGPGRHSEAPGCELRVQVGVVGRSGVRGRDVLGSEAHSRARGSGDETCTCTCTCRERL